ncbi:hypothetical protein Tco_0690114 [Tanacetum coccineum]
MYAEVFGIDVPLNQSQLTESTEGTHRTPSALRRSTRLTPPASVPTVDKEDEMILQDTLQESLVGHKKNVIDDSSIPKNDDQNIPGTRLEPRSDKESLEVEITNDEEVEITNVVIPVNVNEEEEEITDEFLSRKSFDTLADHLQKVMVESLPTMVDKHIKEQIEKQVPEQMKFETLPVPQTTCRTPSVRSRDQDDPHDDAHPKGENSAKRQKTSEYEAHVTRESSGQVNEKEQGQSSSRNQEQTNDYDFWTESYASDDDEILTKQESQDIMKEVSLTINEAKLKKIADEMLRQRYPEAQALSLINQDLLYLKKGSSRPEKIVLSLHKFLAIIFNDVDIKERTSRWNPHAKIFYIKRQKEPGKPKEVVYSNSKIIQVIKTYWELGHEHKFITEIVIRRANECIMSITESDYKNLSKNDIEDMYLLIMNGKVPDYAETEIEKHKMFSIIYEPVHGIIYKNSKKEKRVTRHSEIHKDLTSDEVDYLKLFEEEIEVSQSDEKMGDVCEWKTTWTAKKMPRIIDP